jgi:hypothetical protein
MSFLTILLILILAVILIANAMLIGGVYFIISCLLGAYLKDRAGWRRSRWVRAAATAGFLVALPVLLNTFNHYERYSLASDEKAWDGSFDKFGVVALLSDRLEDKQAVPAWRLCEPHRCKGLLFGQRAKAFLVGPPPSVGTSLDPAWKVVRYHIEQRAWCPPLVRMDNTHGGRNLAELTHLAAGECLVGEPATLADADIVVVDQPLDPLQRPGAETGHGGVTGQRLALYTRDGANWKELFRKTEVGGSDWFVPMLIGPQDRNLFGALMFGGGLVGFASWHTVEAKPIDLDGWLKRWKLYSVDAVVPAEKGVVEALAKKALLDPSLPADSATMQFLATYAWLNDWDNRDRSLQAEIIRDPRVTDFSPVPNMVTPEELAKPLLDRILNTPVAKPADQEQLKTNRRVVEQLAAAFSRLPACAAFAIQPELRVIAHDEALRPYAADALTMLADSGPAAADDFEYLLRVSRASIGKYDHPWYWKNAEGGVLMAALEGLTRLGTQGKAAAPEVAAVLDDKDVASAFSSNIFPPFMPNAGIDTLISMGEIERLRSLYAGTSRAALVETLVRRWKPRAVIQCQGKA